MIKTFSHKGLEKFFIDGSTAGIQPKHKQKLAFILDRLDAAETHQDMNLPGLRLHSHIGNKKNERQKYSVDVNGNWRVTFEFEGTDAHVVDYTDPH